MSCVVVHIDPIFKILKHYNKTDLQDFPAHDFSVFWKTRSQDSGSSRIICFKKTSGLFSIFLESFDVSKVKNNWFRDPWSHPLVPKIIKMTTLGFSGK